MKKRFFIFGLTAVFIAFSLHSNEQTKLTLRQCIETGLANKMDVLKRKLQMKSDKIKMNKAKMNLMTNING